MSSLATIQKHYLRILRLWPKDHQRSLTFQTQILKRLDARFTTPAIAPEANIESNDALVTPKAAEPDLQKETAQLNAMYSLLENRYSEQYPCSPELMRPTFNPDYYSDLLREMEEAPKRNWFQKQMLKWSKVVRFQ